MPVRPEGELVFPSDPDDDDFEFEGVNNPDYDLPPVRSRSTQFRDLILLLYIYKSRSSPNPRMVNTMLCRNEGKTYITRSETTQMSFINSASSIHSLSAQQDSRWVLKSKTLVLWIRDPGKLEIM